MISFHINTLTSRFSDQIRNQLNDDYFESQTINYIEEKTKSRVYPESNILAFQIGDLDHLLLARYGTISGENIEENDDQRVVQLIMPHDLNNITEDTILKWQCHQLHEYTSQIARNINEDILMAELFSGTIATSEMITYGIIKKKCERILHKTEKPKIYFHYIPTIGKINLNKFVEFRSNELPLFNSFRDEWKTGRGIFDERISSEDWIHNLNIKLNECKKEMDIVKKSSVRVF